MFVIGDPVQVRTLTPSGDEVWEDGTVREVEHPLIYVDLASPVAMSTRAGKRDLVTVPVAEENVRPAPEDIVEEIPPEEYEAVYEAGLKPGPRMTRREQAAYAAMEHHLQPNTPAMRGCVIAMIFLIALVIGAVIGIALG
jgi:hypothetical protein